MLLTRHIRRDERGVTLILFALCLTALLVLTSLVIDTGLVYNERKQDQNAADAAALAAIQTLIDNRTRAEAEALIIAMTYDNVETTVDDSPSEWAERWKRGNCSDPDMPSSYAASATSDCISWHDPLSADDTVRVRVRLPTITISSTFGRVVGVDSFQTSAAAEGEMAFEDAQYAIFGISGTCGRPDRSENDNIVDQVVDLDPVTVTGIVHSNKDVHITAESTATEVRYVGGISSNSDDFVGGPFRKVGQRADPLDGRVEIEQYVLPDGSKARTAAQAPGVEYVVPEDIDPGVGDVNKTWLVDHGLVGTNDELLSDFLLVTNRRITLDGPLRHGGHALTLVSSEKIVFAGSGFDLRPWDPDGILAFTTAHQGNGGCREDDAMEIGPDEGSPFSGTLGGILYAPEGGAEIGALPGSQFGTVMANAVDTDGGGLNFSSAASAPRLPFARLYK